MRKNFPGHYTPTNDEFKSIWTEGLIIFDTNVLLDFYRYSDETVEILFQIMEKVKDRIWIPYQVSKEYHKNLSGVISGQIKKYSDSIKTLQDFRKQINEKRNHPFLIKELHTEINDFCLKFDKELEQKRNNFKKIITSNPSKEKIADILDEKLGISFKKDELEKIYLEGKERYDLNVPPGYKDKNNKPEPERYNDLVIWKEILNKNKEIDIPILLITGDNKEDWFQKEIGLTIGPRPELIEEFKSIKDNLFYCYSTDKFLKYSEEYLGIKVDDTIVEEVGKYISKPRADTQTESNPIKEENFEQTTQIELIKKNDKTESSVGNNSNDDSCVSN